MSHNEALSPVPLPAPPSSFIGRRDEIAELKRILTDYRQVTLVGSGGCGKTRLAIRAAEEMAPHFPDGVAFVDLAGVEDPDMVAASVAAALSPRCEGTDGLMGLIGDRRILLVIDNAEQVVHGLAPLVADLLVRCPYVGALVTSRELLDISGERCWRVPPLGLPPADAPADPDLLATYAAIELFAIRALERGGAFRLTPENARLVVSICRRLGGMPLALELAAARVGSFGLKEIEDRLCDALRLLIGGTRTAVDRHRTLRASIDWSHRWLSDTERSLLGRLAAFAGPFDLNAAETRCSDPSLPAEEVADVLQRLVDKSLVLTHLRPDGGLCYSLSEAHRQYALQRPVETGESDYPARHAPPVRPAAAGRTVELTPRRQEIVRLVATGLTDKEIARRLSISNRTVNAHLERVRDQLGVHNRAQIAAWATSHGLLTDPG